MWNNITGQTQETFNVNVFGFDILVDNMAGARALLEATPNLVSATIFTRDGRKIPSSGLIDKSCSLPTTLQYVFGNVNYDDAQLQLG